MVSIILISVVAITNPSFLGLNIQKIASLKEMFPLKSLAIIFAGAIFLNGFTLIISKKESTKKLCIQVYKAIFKQVAFLSLLILITTLVSG